MKRTLLQRGAIIAACAAAFVLGGCGDTEFDSRTDTVYSLDTPSVTAKAYPGVNIVSWKPVPGAKTYKVSVFEEGISKATSLTSITEYTCYDTNLVNGKTYTYYVEAISDSNPGTTIVKAVYATNSRGEASARAIVPPADTEALALPAYENGYDGTTVRTVADLADADKKWIVATDKINAFRKSSEIIVEFPVKAYLEYTVKYYLNKDGLEDAVSATDGKDSLVDGNTVKVSSDTNNVTGKAAFKIIPNGGDSYEIVVVANARGQNFKSSKEIVAANKVTIKQLNVTGEATPSVEWVLKDDKFAADADKKVRVSFTPATQTDNGNKVPTDWYTVYSREIGTSTNIAVAGTVSVDETGKYYIEDTVDVTKAYVYTAVISHKDSDGTVSYGSAKESDEFSRYKNYTNPYTAPSISGYGYVLTDNKFIEGASKLVRVSFSPAKKNGEVLSTDSHKVYRRAEDENVWTELAATIKINDESTSPSTIVSTITYYAEDDTVIDVTKTYYYKVVVTDGIKYKESIPITVTSQTEFSISSISVTVNYPSSSSSKTVWDISATDKARNAQLSAKYLIVESTRDLSNVPVLVDEILAKGTTVNLAQVKVDDKVVSGEYTVTAENYTFTGDSAYIYLAVQAKLDGYNTTNIISDERTIHK